MKEQAGTTDVAAAVKQLSRETAQSQTVVRDPESQQIIRIIPFGRTTNGSGIKTQFPQGALLTYWGGPVISNIQVVVVFWGSNVTSAITANGTLDQFYTDITTSRYFDLLTEYSTAGIVGHNGTSTSNQSIGHGTFAGKFTITPSLCPGTAACTITDAQIQTELTNQINAHALPGPITDAHGIVETYYAIYFPPQVTINLQGTLSCVSGGFCAYHSTTGSLLPYGVVPDLSTGGCSLGCGPPSTFLRATVVSAHEMAEAITDADVGAATVFGPPLGWYDDPPDLGEIADLCDPGEVIVTAGANTYTVESLFSNLQNDCVTAPPALKITAPAQTGPNAHFNGTLAIQSSVTHLTLPAYTGTVHFTSSDSLAVLPADYTFVAGDAGSHTFSFTLNTLGDQTITATDVRSGGFIGSTTVNVNNTPDVTITKSHNGNFVTGQTGASYTITVSNVGGGTTSGTVTVTDALPGGLAATAISGTGWACTLGTLTCTRSDALAGNNSYPAITLTVNVTATSATNVVNSATVAGGNDGNVGNNVANDLTVIAAPFIDLQAGIAANNVIAGTNGYTYTVSITNIGNISSTGIVTASTSPGNGMTATAISGTGWTCTLNALSCTRSDALAPGLSYPAITITANISLNAPPTSTISASVAGGGDSNALNNSTFANVSVSPPVSIVSNTASVTVTAGQAAQYTIGMSIGSAAGTVNFSCSGLPTAATCSFNPASLTSSGNVTMTVTTTARGAVVNLRHPAGRNPWLLLGLLSLALLATLTLMLRNQPRARKIAPVLGTCALLLVAVLAGCGGGGTPQTITNPIVGTPAGTYLLTFTATSANGSASKTMTLTVN